MVVYKITVSHRLSDNLSKMQNRLLAFTKITKANYKFDIKIGNPPLNFPEKY